MTAMSSEIPVSTAVPVSGARFSEMEDLGYKPVPVLAPVGLVLGICSFVALIFPVALAIPVLAAALSLVAGWQIRSSQGEFGGKWLARLGVLFAALFLCSGTALHAYTYATEVPPGFERVNFYWLSKQQPVFADGQVRVAEEARQWDGKQVFIKGYMYPTRQLTGIKEFVLCRDNGDCCFGGQPKLTDMIVVKMKKGMAVNHKDQLLVSVAGKFKAKPVFHAGELVNLYTLEETSHFR